MEFWSGLLTACIRLGSALLIGIIIGIEREYKSRAAGIKTHVLVCLGAAQVMMTGEYAAMQYPELKIDVTRIGAQVVSGVGFLGVGTIIITGKNQVRGLTTAAGLWACACTGLAIGIGYIQGTVAAVSFIMFTFKILKFLDLRIQKNKRKIDIFIEFESNKGIPVFLSEMRNAGIQVTGIDLTRSRVKGEGPVAMACCEVPEKGEKNLLFQNLEKISCIRHFEEL